MAQRPVRGPAGDSRVSGRCRGSCSSSSRRRATSHDEDLELAHQVAGAASGALDRSRAVRSGAHRPRRSRSSWRGPAACSRPSSIRLPCSRRSSSRRVSLLGVDAAALAAPRGRRARDRRGGRRRRGAGARQRARPATGWVAGDVVQSRAPVALRGHAASDGLAESDAAARASVTAAYLGVPLPGRKARCTGCSRSTPSSPASGVRRRSQALVALAANASVALSNAELYQHVALEREQSVAILANIADGIVAVDREGQVVLWNAGGGADHRRAGGRGARPHARAGAAARSRVRERCGTTTARSRSSRRPRGLAVAVARRSCAIPPGAVAGRIFAFRDISAERVVEQMKSDFVSTVSVELRAPLTSIYGFAQTLLREDISFGDAERRTFLEFIAPRVAAADVDRRCAAQRRASRHRRPAASRSCRPTSRVVVADVVSAAGAAAERPSPRCRRRRGAAVGASGSREASAGARPASSRTRSDTRPVGVGQRLGTAPRRLGRGCGRRRGSRHPGVRAGPDLREVLPGGSADRAQVSGSSSPRASCARWAGGSGSTPRRDAGRGLRSSFPSRGRRQCEFRPRRDNGLNGNARAGDRRRGADPAALPGQPRGGGDGGARGGGRPERSREGARASCPMSSCST